MSLQIVRTSTTTDLSVPSDIPSELLARWRGLPATVFSPGKAVQCYRVTQGEWRDFNALTPSEARDAGAPTIGAIKTYCGRNSAIQVVVEMLASAAVLLNVGKNIRAEQAFPIAEILIDENPLFTVADFRLAMRMGGTGQFGKTYDRFDLEVAQRWLREYEQIRFSPDANQPTGGQFVPDDLKRGWSACPDEVKNAVQAITQAYTAANQPKVIEPDEVMLRSWRNDWQNLVGDDRPTWENYKTLKVAMLQQLTKQ